MTPSKLVDILSKLRDFESMPVLTVFNGHPGKDYDIADIPNRDARTRLVTLRLDDRDQISRLRLSGEERLYGFRDGNVFFILWWDPEHTIWPSQKK